MRYLGIDFGTKRIGVALSDEAGTMAFPHSTVKNDSQALVVLVQIVKENGVEKIVMGESFDYRGQPNAVMSAITRFAEALEKQAGVPLVYERETLTTREASHIQGEHSKIDASAAALILTSYLDKQRA